MVVEVVVVVVVVVTINVVVVTCRVVVVSLSVVVVTSPKVVVVDVVVSVTEFSLLRVPKNSCGLGPGPQFCIIKRGRLTHSQIDPRLNNLLY